MAADGILALIGFNAMFYLNILLSVALFLTVLLTLSRWYRDSEMIVWFTSGQSLTACLKPILLFAAPFLVAIVAAVAVPVAVGRAAQARVRAAARVARRDLDPVAGPVPRVPARGPRGLRREHQPVRRHDPQRLPAVGRRQEGRDDRRARSATRGRAERRPLHRARGRPALRRQAGLAPNTGSIEFEKLGRRIEPAEARALPASRQGDSDRALLVADGRIERAELFWRMSVPILALVLTLLAIPLAYVNPRMGRSFNLIAAAFLYMLYTQLHQHRAEHDRAGQDRLLGRAAGAARRSRCWSCCCCSATAVDQRAVRGARRRRRRQPADDAHADPLHRPRRPAARRCSIFVALLGLFAFFDLINEMRDVGRGSYTIGDGAALRRAAPAVAPLRAVSRSRR